MLVNNHGEVLLEKRPPAGIWGGLWSFPEFEIDDELDESVHDKLGMVLVNPEQWDSFRHTFSHYHLHIEPLKAFTESDANAIADSKTCWYPLAEVMSLGVSAPVKSLLSRLEKSL